MSPDPRMIATSTRKRRAMRQEFKVRHDYDRNPPRCGNCTYLLQRAQGNTESPAHGPFCNAGKFETVLAAVCDAWEGRRGERLDDSG